VCSKNDEAIAKEGFAHPDSVLKLEDFSAFKANWEPKHENILAIALELGLGVESFVFVDDNPAERAIVEAQLPDVAVPDIGNDVSRYASIIESKRYFEQLSLEKEDLLRSKFYKSNELRANLLRKFANYEEYLDSLEMTAEISDFNATYIERIAQLTNKTNQFNLTTRRYTLPELEEIARDGKHICLYGKLSDRFGDNGLVSVLIGRIDEHELHVELWLMSCRVLKREMEIAMLDSLIGQAKCRGIELLVGTYLPTPKNGLVAEHYKKLGFSFVSGNESGGPGVWSLNIANYVARSRHIKILEHANG
jgi:FkbH-like protein